MSTYDKDDIGLLGCLGALAYFAITTPFTAALYGYALSKLWAWFMVPSFQLPPLGIAAAIGVSLTVRLITYQSNAANERDENKSLGERLIGATILAVMLPLLSLGLGWIAKQWM